MTFQVVDDLFYTNCEIDACGVFSLRDNGTRIHKIVMIIYDE
jgi:hypothetical protein